ncbi:DUF2332 family protein [Nocardioides sp. NPDC059952]|uniref:DUF2332 family protein n=1 Tax=Nocardioides sp. NPDC059952 TaxID=3347014 RepID=UPI0036503DFE
MTLPEPFRDHFGPEEHLYGWLVNRFADDLDSGGPTAEICRDHLDASRADAVQLRLLAALHRIVLRGDAPELERFYPNLGGTDAYATSWPLFEEVVAAHVDELRGGLEVAPQTNEVGRSACLLIGIFEAVRRTGLHRIRLLEPGASAGLNLLVDRYRFRGDDWAYGPTDSPLTIDTQSAGARPVPFEVVARRGCDLAPVDVSTAAGREYLTSFVYWPADVRAGVRAAVDEARERMPIAHVGLEGVPPAQKASGWDIRTDGPALRLDGDVLARSTHHGPPLILV